MRISSAQIFDAGTVGIQRNQFDLFKLQNQLSTGRRVLAPEDDPVAASQALMVSQSKEVTAQYADNQASASSQLGLVEGALTSVGDLLQNVRDRVVQAGNTTLTNNDRAFIATELEARLSELVGLSNTADGSGQFMFSGYQGATRPFAIDAATSAAAPALEKPYAYSGDDGERLQQVSASRQMATNFSGSDVFMDIKSGNGTFVTGVGGNSGGGINKGSATIDTGSVLDPGLWQTAVNAHTDFRIEFSVDGVTGQTEYQLYDNAGNALLYDPDLTTNPGPNTTIAGGHPYTPGQAITLQQTRTGLATPVANFGTQVVIQGQPAAGDRFTIEPSTGQSMFQTLQNLIGVLRTPIGSTTFTTTEFSNRLGAELTNIDRALENVSTTRATVGARLNELDSLASNAADLDIQYASTLSDLQDLDYAAAISNFSRRQLQLEAAQKSFAQISQLSLFNVL